MPEALTHWYHTEAPFFRELRQLRNGIAHHGQRPSSIFETEWGFAISPLDRPWNLFDARPGELQWEGRLGSLRTIFAGFIAHSLEAMTRFASTIPALGELPPRLEKICGYSCEVHSAINFFGFQPCGNSLGRVETRSHRKAASAAVRGSPGRFLPTLDHWPRAQSLPGSTPCRGVLNGRVAICLTVPWIEPGLDRG